MKQHQAKGNMNEGKGEESSQQDHFLIKKEAYKTEDLRETIKFHLDRLYNEDTLKSNKKEDLLLIMDMVNKQSNSIQNECAKDYLESLKMEKAQPMNLSENNINTYTYSNLEKNSSSRK